MAFRLVGICFGFAGSGASGSTRSAGTGVCRVPCRGACVKANRHEKRPASGKSPRKRESNEKSIGRLGINGLDTRAKPTQTHNPTHTRTHADGGGLDRTLVTKYQANSHPLTSVVGMPHASIKKLMSVGTAPTLASPTSRQKTKNCTR